MYYVYNKIAYKQINNKEGQKFYVKKRKITDVFFTTLIILYLDILSISRLDLYIFGLKYNSQHFFVFKIPFFTFHKFPTSSLSSFLLAHTLSSWLRRATPRLIQCSAGTFDGRLMGITKFVLCPVVESIPLRSDVLYNGA